MNLLNRHPFEIWQSPAVTKLLADFFVANYTWAGIPKDQAEEFVMTAWKGKGVIDTDVLWKECAKLLLQIKDDIKVKVTENEEFSLIKLDGVETFLDIGANRLAAINYYARRYEAVKFIGVDIIPQNGDFMFPDRGEYYQVEPDATSFPIPPGSVDVILIQHSFHHFPNEAAIRNTLNICQGLLKPGGKLILMEETFTQDFDYSTISNIVSNLGLQTDENLTRRFYDLTPAERWEFIIANDWLINVHNPHMQWTGQYRTWEEWTKLISEYGLNLQTSYNLGLRLNGRLKQGVHMVGEFQK